MNQTAELFTGMSNRIGLITEMLKKRTRGMFFKIVYEVQ